VQLDALFTPKGVFFFVVREASVHSRISLQPPIFDNLSNFAIFVVFFAEKKG